MMDFGARRACTLVAGVSGSGKTTFCLRYLVHDRSLGLRLVWDADGQLASRLGLPAATTAQELSMAVEDGWVVFDPNVMFPGRHSEGFSWFCGWAYQVAGSKPGRKCLLVDEVWRYCTNTSIPQTLAECIQTGRVRSLDTMFAVQRPNRLNEAITNEATEFVAFRLQGANALKTVESLGADPSAVWSLPPGRFESWNLESGGRLSGRVF
jgi:hypothetical protein